MALATFLVEADPPVLAIWIVVLDAHGNDRTDSGEGKSHHADQRPVTQPDDAGRVDAVQDFVHLSDIQHRGLSGLNDIPWTTDRAGRVCRDDPASDQPVEQHANSCQVLLHRRCLDMLSQRLDVGRHVQWFDVGESARLMVLAPGEKAADRVKIRRPCVLIADSSGKEFPESASGVLSGIGDDRRHDHG